MNSMMYSRSLKLCMRRCDCAITRRHIPFSHMAFTTSSAIDLSISVPLGVWHPSHSGFRASRGFRQGLLDRAVASATSRSGGSCTYCRQSDAADSEGDTTDGELEGDGTNHIFCPLAVRACVLAAVAVEIDPNVASLQVQAGAHLFGPRPWCILPPTRLLGRVREPLGVASSS